MAARTYTFVADTDSLEALRRLRHGWASWEIAEGEFRVRLREGGTVHAYVDRGFAEPGFELACVVADWLPDASTLPLRDSPFTSQRNEVAVFRGVTWLEPRPDLGPDHTIQYSAIPGFALPDEAVASCEFTDAVAITAADAALVVRLALRPGWLEVVEDPEQIAEFFRLRGFA